MGWRGALRSLGALAREAERNARRRERQRERYLAAVQKAQELEQAAQAVADYEAYIANIISVHKTGLPPIDWASRAQVPEPLAPTRSSAGEDRARRALETYRPSALVRLFRLEEKRVKALQDRVEQARGEDEEAYERAWKDYESKLAQYQEEKELADGVLADDPEVMMEVIQTVSPFAAISELGSEVRFCYVGGRRIAAEVDVHSESIIPKESISLLKSGRASVKALPKGRYYGLYQDYVCSVVLRVARELFAILPLEAVVVTAVDELVSSETGHIKKQAILSVLIPAATFTTLNLETLDPSDAMRNFIHRMDFRANSGLRPVEPLDAKGIALNGGQLGAAGG